MHALQRNRRLCNWDLNKMQANQQTKEAISQLRDKRTRRPDVDEFQKSQGDGFAEWSQDILGSIVPGRARNAQLGRTGRM